MQLPRKGLHVLPSDRVLDVGPGSAPFEGADVYLERRFASEEERVSQAGYARPVSAANMVYYDGGTFPFRDREFDYVVCSHVIEHIPDGELESFIGELQRVGGRGYIEFPNVFYEIINYQPVHLWLMNLRDEEMLFLDKRVFRSNPVHEAYRALFYLPPDRFLTRAFKRYPRFFFEGLEWKERIRFVRVGTLEELVTEEDLMRVRCYLRQISVREKNSIDRRSSRKEFWVGLMSRVRRIRRVSTRCMETESAREEQSPGAPGIHGTTVLSPRENIHIAASATIQEYVIIRAPRKAVIIGPNSQINPFTVIYGGAGVTIGSDVMIGPHCVLAAGSHEYRQIHTPMRWADSWSRGPIIIEDDVWVGANVTIRDGVHIGHGAVIGANSVVTGSVDDYDIVAGCPARSVGNRRDK